MTVRRGLPLMLIAACGGSLEGVDEAAVDDADVAAATSQVVAYSEDGWDQLADAFQADKAAGAVFFLHIPALANDKMQPRGPGAPAALRARGSHFRAMAEFHWGGWHADSRTWYEKGVEFRRRMAAAGYDVSKGDTWAINELPSSFRSDPS